MIHHQVQQNTEEWMKLRSGKFTASMFKDLFAGSTTITRQKAIYKVAFERVTGEQPESFKNEYMERGHELEPLACDLYEMETFNTTEEPGFFELNEWVGASPDRLIEDDGLLEIKSPAYNTMINYLLNPKLPTIYEKQVHGQMWVAQRNWCDFMCYHPKLKPIIIRVERDDAIIGEIQSVVAHAIQETKQIIKQIS